MTPTAFAHYHGSSEPSSLRATHPQFAYYEANTGILLFGRPIRSNFYVYKLSERDGVRLAGMLTDGVHDGAVLAFADRHQVRWSQRVDRQGYESRFNG